MVYIINSAAHSLPSYLNLTFPLSIYTNNSITHHHHHEYNTHLPLDCKHTSRGLRLRPHYPQQRCVPRRCMGRLLLAFSSDLVQPKHWLSPCPMERCKPPSTLPSRGPCCWSVLFVAWIRVLPRRVSQGALGSRGDAKLPQRLAQFFARSRESNGMI